ncbi:MAG TPA: dephospho-CoA kinase [Gaiellaceae bacterium]|nr:dephospho-CoA kinase [Gaiellaceae bacterium]
MSRPISVAITGGIGAGKSEALAAFAECGAATVSSDEIVHHLLRHDQEVRAALVAELGEGILGDDGHIDRGRVADIVFRDRSKLDFLEALLHPRVAAEYLRWREQLAELPNPPRVCVTEVPLLYESGGESRFDKVVVITAPAKLREQRRRVRRDDREERLLPDKEKVKRADYAYVNTGTLEELDAWVAGVMTELTAA